MGKVHETSSAFLSIANQRTQSKTGPSLLDHNSTTWSAQGILCSRICAAGFPRRVGETRFKLCLNYLP